MRPIVTSLVALPLLAGLTLAGCSVRTERTVYTPAPAPATYYPANTYYYPATTYYVRPAYDAYHPAYTSY